jgi:hypothetical protein
MPGLWSGMQGARRSGIARPTVRPWRCFALCWSCGAEVPSHAATHSTVEHPMRWHCPDCDVQWSAYADRVEVPEPVMTS